MKRHTAPAGSGRVPRICVLIVVPFFVVGTKHSGSSVESVLPRIRTLAALYTSNR
jgi:hypothetical protein